MGTALILSGMHLLCLVAGGYFIRSATEPAKPPDPVIAAGKNGPRATRARLIVQGKAPAGLLASAPELRGHVDRYADPSVPLDERIARMKNLARLKDR